jgi:serine/threonine protein kinase
VIAEGSVVASKYLVEARLGEGGMGAVFRAKHLELGRTFAIKVLHPSLVQNATVLARFRREAELAGRLRHDHVVSVVDLGVTADNEQYLVMEYAPGTSLATLLEPGPMAEARVLEIARQLCAGLQHAHDAGLIHRDFKPDNVIVETLVDGREIARIVDFGVAILRDNARDVDKERLTTKGIVVGTPRYMAPEHARGGAVDHRADLFSLGLMLYELLAGKPPFDGSGAEVARANVHMPTPIIGVRAPGVRVEPVLEALVYKLLSKNPDDRLPSAKAVHELLDLYIRDRATAAALLGVRANALQSSGLPPLQQLAAGRGRSANISATPYQHLVEAPRPLPPPPSELGIPAVTSRRPLAIAAVIGALVFAAGIYLSTRSRPREVPTPMRHVVTPKPPSDPPPRPPEAPPSEPAVPSEAPETPLDVIAISPRKQRKVPPVTAPVPTPTPVAKRAEPSTTSAAPTPSELAELYMRTGRAISALSKNDREAADTLWPRYRWIRFNDALTTPEKRAEAARLLETLLVTTRGQGSAAN